MSAFCERFQVFQQTQRRGRRNLHVEAEPLSEEPQILWPSGAVRAGMEGAAANTLFEDRHGVVSRCQGDVAADAVRANAQS